jgi:hypothetical protein
MQPKKEVNIQVLKLLRDTHGDKAISPREWRTAYAIVREKAIAQTILWKQSNITIERC